MGSRRALNIRTPPRASGRLWRDPSSEERGQEARACCMLQGKGTGGNKDLNKYLSEKQDGGNEFDA